jgi:hypothetical protein
MTSNIRYKSVDRSLLKVVFAFLIITSWSSLGYGQIASTTTLTINVRDSLGAAVPNAAVTIRRKPDGKPIERTTNNVGVVIFDGLTPGLYDVMVDKDDFELFVRSDFEITLSQTNALDVTLSVANKFMAPPGDVTAPVVEPRGEEISALPNLNSDLTNVLTRDPGAVAIGSSSLGRVIVDGRGNDQRILRLDGVDFTSQVDFPAVDSAINAVGSFETPAVSGDQDNVTTRSGAFPPIGGPGTGLVSEAVTYSAALSKWKFQLYGDMRNDALDARNFFDFDGKNSIRRARFGGKAGGPVPNIKRAFIFMAYDGWRGRIERNIYEAVPVDARNGGVGPLAQDVRAFLPPGTEEVPGELRNQDFSLNQDFILARRRARTTADSDAANIRLDYFPYKTSDADCPQLPVKECSQLTVRFTHQTAENNVPDGVTGRSQRQRFVFANGLAGFRLVTHTKELPGPLDATKPKPRDFGHNFRFGFNLTRAHVDVLPGPLTGNDLSHSLITIDGNVGTDDLPLAPAPAGQLPTVPIATLGGLIRGGVGRGLDLKPISYSALYDYSRPIKGNHELYTGVEARFIKLDFDRLGGLTYAFPNVAALQTNSPSSVSFQADLNGPGPFTEGSSRRQARQEFYMGYLQFVSQFLPAPGFLMEPALTLTYGLRYDYFGRVREKNDRAMVVNPLNGEELPRGTPFYRTDYINLQPRFGFAYRLGNVTFKQTTLRGGIGLYSGVPRISDLLLPIESDRFGAQIDSGKFPTLSDEIVRSFRENSSTRQFQPLAFARDFSPLERSLKWEIRFGHIREGYDFSVYYAGNRGINLGLAKFANRITSVTTNPDPTKKAIIVREFDKVINGLPEQALGEIPYRLGGGYSSYNAVTFQIGRDKKDTETKPAWIRYAVASFSAKYTLSRSVGNVSGAVMSNPFDPDADFGHNSGTALHNFTFNASYNLWDAFVTSKDRLTDFLRGWKIMPSLKASSGPPLIIRLPRADVVYIDGNGNVFDKPAVGRTAHLNTGGGGQSSGAAFAPNLVAGVNPYTGGRADRLFLDPAAFAIPAPGEFGNLKRGAFRGPSVVQFDLAVRRNFHLGQFGESKLRGEFQVDFYNLFNRANFSNPTASLPGSLGNSSQNEFQPGVPFTRVGAGTFGFLTASDIGRLVQFSFTVKFNDGFTK